MSVTRRPVNYCRNASREFRPMTGTDAEMLPGRHFARILHRYFVAGWLTLIGGALEHAQAQQLVLPPPPPPPPVFNPSNPYTVPNAPPTPVSPELSSKLPNSEFCSVFHLGPCFPQYLPPIGQDLRLTIVSGMIMSQPTHPPQMSTKAAIRRRTKSRWIRSAKCMPRYAHAGRHLPRLRHVTAWNTPSVSPSNATDRSPLRRGGPIRPTERRMRCAIPTATPSTRR